MKVLGSTCMSINRLALPTITGRDSTIPVTPLPGSDRTCSARGICRPFSSALWITAAASGCSLARSRLAASRSTSLLSSAMTDTTRGRPSVSVPVLSTTKVSTFSNNSSASALRIKMPAVAPRPVATITDMGVARPSAQGQAIISTATAFTSANAIRGSGPKTAHTINVITAIRTTIGTKNAATASATR
jgi:hypothetical protein